MSEPLTDKDFATAGEEAENAVSYGDGDFKEKLTDWDNEPTIGDLKTDLTEVTNHHDSHVKKVDEWLDNLYIRGKAKPQKRKGYSEIQPKLIRKQAEWRYAALSEPFLATNDLFTASPVTWEDKKSAEQNQLILNTQFRRDIPKTRFFDEYVRTAVNEGTVVLRTGWDYMEETVLENVPVNIDFQPSSHPDDIELIQEVATMAQTDPIRFDLEIPPELKQALQLSIENEDIIVPVILETEEQEVTKVITNRPTVEVVHYDDIMIDPTCRGDIEKAKFAIYRFRTSLADLKKEGIYSNLDFIREDSTTIFAMPDDSVTEEENNFTFHDKPRKQFYAHEYWGFWDIEGTGELQPIVATFVGDTIIRMDLNPFPDKKLPFIIIPYLPIKDSVYGEPDGILIEDNQKISGAVTRGMVDLMGRSANAQIGYRKDAFDPINKRKFDRGEDYEFNPQIDPRTGFYMHQFPEIPQSAQFMLQLQNIEAESLTGVKAFSGGLSGDSLGETSATGVRGVLDAASKRELGILRRLADGIIQVGHKFIAMNAEFLSEEEVIRITNSEFIKIRRDDLSGRVDLKLNITTAEEDNQKAQELAFMLQTMGNTMPREFSQMILADIAKLRKMPDLSKKIEEFQPQPDPVQQQIQQLEMEKLQAEIAKLQSEAYENQAEAQLDLAKAGQAQSEADLKDLDFLEQQQGITHARERDKITSQAEAQAKKSIVESALPKQGAK
jgi:hypothetical protein